MNHRILTACAALLAALSPSLGHAAGDIQLGDAYARPTVAKQPSGAAYVTIENRGKAADALISASSPAAREVQIHTMKMEGDVMRMRELPKLELAPGTTVTMKPGDGTHLMLIGLKQALKAGDKIPVTLVFEKGGPMEMTVPVEVRAAGSHSHGGHSPQQNHKH